MSRYLARVVQRDGVARYLVRGRLIDHPDPATHYAHPSGARQALTRFLRNHDQRDYISDVLDDRNPERGSV